MSPRTKQPLVPHAAVGERLRLARQRLGLSQRELAEAIKSTQASIAATESGKRGLSLDQFRKLCRALKISPLVAMGDEPPPPPPLEDGRLLRRLHKAQGLSRRQKLGLLKVIDEYFARTK